MLDTMYKRKHLVLFTIILVSAILSRVDSLLISGKRGRRGEENETRVVQVLKEKLGENVILTDIQGISLKEIRKLARLAGHENPELITDFTSEICYSDSCLQAATEFYTSMDFSEDPCNDWGRYACEWRTLSSETALDQQTYLAGVAENQVREILLDRNTEKDTIKLAQSYYDACVTWFKDFSRIDHITSYLDKFGTWPALKGKYESNDNWADILVQVIRIAPENVSPFVLKLEAVALNENGKMILEIDSGSTSCDFDSEDIKGILQILRKSPPPSSQKERDDIRNMQQSLQILSSIKFDGTMKPKVLSLSELEARLSKEIPDSKFNILKFIQSVFDKTDLIITPETQVVTDVDLFVKYISSLHSMDQEALLNIMFLQLALVMIGDTTNILDSRNMLHIENYKRTMDRNPSMHCLKETGEMFNYAMSEEYLQRYFEVESLPAVKNLIADLKEAFNIVVDQIKWLEKSASDFIKEKVKRMEILLAYPKLLFDDEKRRQYYDKISKIRIDLTNDSKAYLNHRSNLLSFINGKFWRMKLEDELVDGWNYKARNGFVGDTYVEYIPTLNQLRIPAGILQPPLFRKDFPGYMNFGGLGSVVAREMARAFDSNGETGNWLDDKSYKKYIDWTTSLKMVWEKNELSLNDEITSILGYHITVTGYEEFLKKIKQANKEDLKLPGLSNLDSEKLLQLKYTNVLCESPVLRRIKTNHLHRGFSSGSFGLFPVTRNKQFAKLFDCEFDNFYRAFDLSL